jgi:hypothetical protein
MKYCVRSYESMTPNGSTASHKSARKESVNGLGQASPVGCKSESCSVMVKKMMKPREPSPENIAASTATHWMVLSFWCMVLKGRRVKVPLVLKIAEFLRVSDTSTRNGVTTNRARDTTLYQYLVF